MKAKVLQLKLCHVIDLFKTLTKTLMTENKNVTFPKLHMIFEHHSEFPSNFDHKLVILTRIKLKIESYCG